MKSWGKFKTLEKLLSDENEGVKSNIVRAYDVKEELYDSFENGEKRGESTKIHKLDHNLTFVPGYQYCFTGYPGSGKSEFVNQLAVLQASHNNRKIAMHSPESYPLETLVNNLMRCYLGKNVTKGWENQATTQEHQIAMDFVHDNFFFLNYSDMPRLDQVLTDFDTLHQTEDVGFFIIDPFNSVAEGAHMGNNNISKYLQLALTQTKMFAVQRKAIMNIVEHPKQVQVQNNGNIPLASPWTLYGGSMWWNKMDCIVSVHREEEHTEIRVWKMKNQRLNGKPNPNDPIELYFDVSANRFNEQVMVNHREYYKDPGEPNF